SLLTVRAAISSARRTEIPRLRSLAFTCSYWRARLLPFVTPLGGIWTPPSVVGYLVRIYPGRRCSKTSRRLIEPTLLVGREPQFTRTHSHMKVSADSPLRGR